MVTGEQWTAESTYEAVDIDTSLIQIEIPNSTRNAHSNLTIELYNSAGTTIYHITLSKQ